MATAVKGGVLIFGDLHLSDKHSGRHKNYLATCFDMMSRINDTIDDVQPSHVVFLGDLVGVREKNISSREVLLEIYAFFKSIYEKLNGNLYVVRGNHDYGQFPEFQFLAGLGCFKTADYFDFDNFVRLHLVDYGCESRELSLLDHEQYMNVVLAHNNFIVPGETTWYASHEGLTLSDQKQWRGVSMVISGHIHNPSPNIVSATLDNGDEIQLFYAGCGTRPTWDSNLWDYTWAVRIFKDTTEDYSWDTVEIKLPPLDEVFNLKDYLDDVEEDDLADNLRKEELGEVLQEIIKYNILTGDPVAQIRALPNTKSDVVDIAVSYVERAFEQVKVR